MNKLITIAMTATLLVTSASAFTFDIWKSGRTMDATVLMAKSKNIPLMKKGSLNKSNKFEKSAIKGYENTRELRYVTKLLQKKSLVRLLYTDTDKKLYDLRVKWLLAQKEAIGFSKRVKEMLNSKYRGAVKKEKIVNGLEITEWYIRNNIIGLQTKGKLIEVYYIDTYLKKLNDEERETKEVFREDSVKF